jgi:D-3-phosphoglycerate dehydrogenase
MAGELARKRVGIRLPRHVTPQSAEQHWAHELEALAPIADIIEIRADTPAEFAAAAGDLDAIITSWGIRIDQEIIGALKRCVVIGVGGVGVDMVDVEAATAAGIVVTNVPDVFIEEVADHAMMLLLNVARMTPLMQRMAREGQWYEARPILSRRERLLGQTLGLYSFGNVARATARRAMAFGMRVITFDPYVSELEVIAAGAEPVSFGELLERSDYLSVHAPHNAETEHSINAAALRRMKPTAGLINTARGPIVDEAALIEALRDGVIAGAGLDVTEQEPASTDNPLLTMDNVIVTPHIASASTRMRPETRRRVGREVALVLRGRWPMSCVNPTVLPRAVLERWQPYPMNRGPNR